MLHFVQHDSVERPRPAQINVAALGLCCVACFEQLSGVFASSSVPYTNSSIALLSGNMPAFPDKPVQLCVPSGKLALFPDKPVQLCVPSGKLALSPDKSVQLCVPSGKLALFPDKSVQLCVPSGKLALSPDKPIFVLLVTPSSSWSLLRYPEHSVVLLGTSLPS